MVRMVLYSKTPIPGDDDKEMIARWNDEQGRSWLFSEFRNRICTLKSGWTILELDMRFHFNIH